MCAFLAGGLYTAEHVEPEFQLYGYIVPEIGGFETDFSGAGFGRCAESEALAHALEVYASIAFGAEEEDFQKKSCGQEGEVQQ